MKQLKKFSDDITQLGNELIRRQEKGETLPRINFPAGISDADDSDDFVFGLPIAGQQPSGGASEEAGEAGAEAAGGDSSSISSDDILAGGGSDGASASNTEEEFDIAALLAEARGENNNAGAGQAQPAMPDISLPGLGGDIGAVGATSAPEPAAQTSAPKEIPEYSADNPFTLPGMSAGASDVPDIDALLSGFADDVDTPSIDINAESGTEPVSDDILNNLASADFGSGGDFSESDFTADSDFSADGGEPDFAVQSAADDTDPGNLFAGLDLPDFGGDSAGGADAGAAGGSSTGGAATGAGSQTDTTDVGSDFSLPDFDLDSIASDSSGVGSAATEDVSADFGLGDTPSFDAGSDAGAGTASASAGDGSSSGTDDFSFDLPDFDIPAGDGASAESAAGADAGGSGILDDDDLFSTPQPSSGSSSGGLSLSIDSEPESGNFELPPDDPFAMPSEGTGFNPDDSGFSPEEAASFEMPEAPDFGDMSEFSMDAPDSGDVSGSFESVDDNFSIPGFSGDDDFDLIPPEVPEAKSSKATSASKSTEKKGRRRKEKIVREKNELTEEEYETFRNNLKGYPLNLRIIIQEIIVNPDFTEEAVMKIIDMVINQATARSIANYLEKESLVDYAIQVPANFEKRTVAEYEEYKKSLEYRLKNRIIPIAIISVITCAFILLFSFLIARFVVRPVKAEMLYKEGYALIENGLYPQSEMKFNEADSYKSKKSWYFEYAHAYKDHKQYERAGKMYERLLNKYDHDKKAGLEYASMELYDLSDYENAERITRREVLDYHINDSDGMLLLGDIFLEWATNTDDSFMEEKEKHFEEARVAYADIMSLYGQTDLYLSRMMRYFIRTDQIREVLPLKNYFYPRLSKNPLEGQDLVELSGYLLDKLFGELKPADEFLRSSIEDVRDLLEQAVIKAPEIPESTYNLGRYFIETENPDAAEALLKESLGIFDAAEKKTHSRILRNINAYRLIGELKAEDKEYIEAEKMYLDGIDIFTNEQKRSGLKSDQNVGILYSDLADIEYFISGDYDSALRNYQYSVDNNHDTASIRYRIGYINYVNGDTGAALDSFIKTIAEQPSERHTLLALGNTLAIRDSTSAAQGYYEKLIDLLDRERATAGVLSAPLREEQINLVELYGKTANNLGVTLYNLAKRNSNSAYNARAISLLSESIRAWDLLTRNDKTMVRIQGTNLAAQNLKYMTVPKNPVETSFEPSLDRVIPMVIYGDDILSKPESENDTKNYYAVE
ncbi:MAG: tetratricopeptide repeat protein [Spirochaetaceae bacterium]|nr:tetratricopeptide repeat protein [Spirochaetaceae bacterium]